MAHPKRKQSKTRTAKRRTHDKAVAPTLALCPNCGAWHIYHTVCAASRLWLKKPLSDLRQRLKEAPATQAGAASFLITQ